MAKNDNKSQEEPLEKQLWKAADKLRKSASTERVRELDYVLTPGRYVGLAVEDDDFDFNERFSKLKAEFEEELQEEARLNVLIAENLEKVKLV